MSTRSQAGRFLVVGVTTVCLDMLIYSGLVWLTGIVSVSKAVGFVGGTIFAYYTNRLWTFAARGGVRTALRFLGVYLGGLGVNVGANSAFLGILGKTELSLAAAFVLATGLSAVFNFVGMKFFAFSEPLKGAQSS